MKNLTRPLKNKMANRFRKIREVLGLTQKELAQKLGRKIQTITDIEIQKSLPTIPLLVDIYTKFNIPFNWLILGEGEMFIKKKPELSQAELFKKAFPGVPVERDVIKLIESMAVPILKNSLILKSLELKEVYKSQIQEYEKEKAQALAALKLGEHESKD
jgi:transcriptional regulator with XRE-family HTH domain